MWYRMSYEMRSKFVVKIFDVIECSTTRSKRLMSSQVSTPVLNHTRDDQQTSVPDAFVPRQRARQIYALSRTVRFRPPLSVRLLWPDRRREGHRPCHRTPLSFCIHPRSLTHDSFVFLPNQGDASFKAYLTERAFPQTRRSAHHTRPSPIRNTLGRVLTSESLRFSS